MNFFSMLGSGNLTKVRTLFRAPRVIGMIRMRDESLILQDTLDHFSQFTDGIVVYDDASKDNSVQIARNHSHVLKVLEGTMWEENRAAEETRHRQALLDVAKEYDPIWLFYSDCDERFDGSIYDFLQSSESDDIDAIKIQLFDAYITPGDQDPYTSGKLLDFRTYFGPERRDIIMIWRNAPGVEFLGLDRREPNVTGNIVTKFYCQHYGKSLSIEHWEETCEYYSAHFPKYAKKWEERKGGAIHEKSDFDRSLNFWDDVKVSAVKIN